ncbi:LysM domain-containing protein [Pseudolactococcus yaeyamensis]
MKTYNHNTNNTATKLSFKTVALLVGLLVTSGLFVTTQTVSADQVTYTVQSGDTLSSISDQFYHDQTHIQTIATANHIDDASLIHVGDTLKFDTTTKADKKTSTEPSNTTKLAAQSTATIATNNGFIVNSAKEAIAMTESGGSYTAQNGQYYGRYQLTASYLNSDFSPENQERVADAYVADRYDSWEAAWQFHLANGWY